MIKSKRVIESDKKTVLPGVVEIYTGRSCYRNADIPACRYVALLERVAAHRDFICSDVLCWNCHDVQKPGAAEKIGRASCRERVLRLV